MYASSNIGAGRGFFPITPHNTNKLTYTARSIYVGVGGDITAKSPDGTEVLFKSVPAGTQLMGEFGIVAATGTTATNLVGYR